LVSGFSGTDSGPDATYHCLTADHIVGCFGRGKGEPELCPAGLGGMNETEITWPRVLSVWWLLTWRTLVGALLISFATGFVIGFLGELSGWPKFQSTLASALVGWIAGLAWAVMVTRMALSKRYGDFRLTIVPLRRSLSPVPEQTHVGSSA
jgi:hypothetical protein